jgi:hypothetical protein
LGSGAAGVAGSAEGGEGVMVDEPPVGLPAFDAGSDPGRNRVKAGEVCARLAAISCAGETHCCTAPGRSIESCRSTLQNSCATAGYIDQASLAAATGFDASLAEQRFAALEQRASQCDPTIATWTVGNDGLRAMFQGTLAPGANCKPQLAGVTDKAKDAVALLSCTDFAMSACLPRSLLGSWNCSPRSGVNGGCVTDFNCQDGMFCNNPNKQPLGSCAQRKPVDGSCADATQCQMLACKAGRCVMPDQQLAFCGQQ